MDESYYIKKRAHPRVGVLLKASFQIQDKGIPEQECLITNLSVSGAGITFPREGVADAIVPGAYVLLKILIPKTVLHISTQAEVMWSKPRPKDVIAGVRFSNMLSESMFQQCQKKAG